MDMLKILRDYFPTAVFTGKCLVFISEDWRVELTEHHDNDYTRSGTSPPIIRVKICKKTLDGDFLWVSLISDEVIPENQKGFEFQRDFTISDSGEIYTVGLFEDYAFLAKITIPE